ncbi:MAG: hypothetical protein DYG94_07785 [Leptolyngbya sp. PLA3]|nr:MAG: hypothetical protein EDM82_10305 [Cyanobacteria bacterium CYA]MCE7968631.1 hypothetical protein [Leptolyngbya sp. PL-A3]
MIARRPIAWASTQVVVAAVLLGVVLGNLSGARTRARFDWTSTGLHRLSPRTEQLLAHLDGRYEIVLAIDRAGVDRASYDAVIDLFSNLSRRSDHVGFRTVDVGQAGGRSQFEALVSRLRDRDRPAAIEQAGLLAASLDRLDRVGVQLADLRTRLETLAESVPTDRADAGAIRRFLQQAGALAGAQGQQTRSLAAEARPPLAPEGSELPDTPRLRDQLVPEFERLRTQVDTLATQLGRYASTDAMPEESRTIAGAMSRELTQMRDDLAAQTDLLRRLEAPPVFRVAAALEAGEACIVIGPPGAGLTAIDRQALFPPVQSLSGAGVAVAGEVARRAEDLVAIALTTLTSPSRPIVVFVHAEIEPLVLTSPSFEQLIEHARLRGLDVIEWATITRPEPPGIEAINPDALRPVVYLVISPNSVAPSPGQDPEMSGARRATRLAATLSALIERGESVLLSVNPSIFPTYGDTDPIAAVLAPFGLKALTGSPLVAQRATQRGLEPGTTLIARGTPGEHPLQRALRDLPTMLLWPIAIDVSPTPGVKTVDLLNVAGGDGLWMENQWIALWQVQAGATSPDVTFDPARDARRPTYTLAAAAERRTGGGPTQRVVLVGSNGWALDRVAQPRAAVDGRLVAVHPGNLELFDACVSWLAGADDEIARGVSGSGAPLIRPLDDTSLSRLRWLAIAGMPMLILLAGVVYRVVKG